MAGGVAVLLDGTEAGGEVHVLLGRDVLVAEEEDQMVVEGVLEHRDPLVIGGPHVKAAHLGTDRRRHRDDLDGP